MNKRLTFLIIILIGIVAGVTYLTADSIPEIEHKDPALGDSDLRFIENQGQWEDWVRYRVVLNGGTIFLEDNRLTYHFYSRPNVGHGLPDLDELPPEERLLKTHTMRVNFKGANKNPQLEKSLIYPGYHNYYFGSDPAKWASKIELNGMVTYKDIYPKTDLRIYGLGDAVKYDFILEPGGNPNDIVLEFEGADKVFLKKGHLHIQTSLREMVELPPLVYQEINGKKVEVKAEFKLKKNQLTYHFPKGYDPAYKLVIDPTLIFSTYTGSPADNWGFTATYDLEGNAYAGGFVWSNAFNSSYPTTVGAHQTTFQGGDSDVTLSKFDDTGANLLFSTYLGGNASEQPHSLVVSDSGELYVYGRTNSSNFPVGPGLVYDNIKNPGFDIFVAKISDTGSLLASTFIGGSGDDGVNGSTGFITFPIPKYNYGDDARGEIILDAAGNPLVAAPSKSIDFPTPGTPAQGGNAGGQDGVIFKMDANLTSLTWATYLGGNGEDAAYTLKLDDQDNVYVAGGTSSTNFPANTNITGYQGGSADGFVAKLNSNGSNLINCTYLGTGSYDQVYLLDLDDEYNVYVCGQSEGNYPVVSPIAGTVYSNPNSKQFITKLENDLSAPIFSTVFGSTNATEPNISPTAMLVDRCDNIYVTGWGGTTNNNGGNVIGMPLTGDALDANPHDGSDFYMIVLSRDAQSLIYGSYIGGNNTAATSAGDHVDGGTSRFDKNGIIYHAVCAGCWGNSSFPAQPGGVWSTTNGASGGTNAANGCNLAVFKIAFDLAGIEADFEPLDENNQPIVQTQGCAPLTVNFDNQSFTGANPGTITYFWDFDDNGATSTLFEPTYTFQNAGTYDVMLIITDSTSCNIADTTFRTILVFPPPVVDAGPDQTICEGDTFNLATQSSGVSYVWSPNVGFITNDSASQVTAVGINSGFYYLTLTDAQGCSETDSVFINVDNTFEVVGSQDTVICRGGTVSIGATSNGGQFYEWSSFPNANINDPTLQNPTITNVDTTTMFYVRSENALGCESIDSIQVEVFEVFTLEDTFVCDGLDIVLLSSNGVSWQWSPTATLDDPTLASPTASPLVTTTYTVTATSIDGCISTKDVLVEVRDNPVAEAGPDLEMCFGRSVNLQASGGLTYAWTPGGDLSDSTIANPVASPPFTTEYFVTVYNASGCEHTDSMTVSVNQLPPVDAGNDATICEGESQELFASGASTFIWTPTASLDNSTIANPVATPGGTTTYTVVGTDASGCENTDSVTVTVVPRPVTEIDGLNQICIGGSIVLTASGGDTYLWSTGETTPSISVIPTQTTTYTATTFVGQCEGIPASITVDVFFDYPEASFTADPGPGFSPQIVTFTNTSTGAASYIWDFGFGQGSDEVNPSHGYPAAGQYTVTLIAFSDQGCPDTATQDILIENVALHVPSGFTPNADGTNDFFQVGYYGIGSLIVKIYSRWGIKIYESDNKDFQWDGTYKGVAVPEGVYVYVIEGVGLNGLNYERNGTVTLIR